MADQKRTYESEVIGHKAVKFQVYPDRHESLSKRASRAQQKRKNQISRELVLRLIAWIEQL
jgi:hypothetical protein